MLNCYQDTIHNINDFEKLNNNQFLGIFDFISDNANKNNGELFLSQKFKVKFKFFERTFSSNLNAYNQVAKEIKELIGEIEKTK